jgi:hypothetical protein
LGYILGEYKEEIFTEENKDRLTALVNAIMKKKN